MATAQQKTRTTKQAKPKTRASSAPTSGTGKSRRRTTSGSGNDASPNGSSRVKAANTSGRARASSSSNGAARNGSTRAKAANSNRRTRASSSSNGAKARRQSNGASSGARAGTTKNRSQGQSGMLAKVGHVGSDVVHGIDRAKPAIAVGMTALGVAGGIAFRRRQRTVLGIAVPRKPNGVDIIALSKAIGKGSLHLSQTARSISKDIDQAAERAEKIGKILS